MISSKLEKQYLVGGANFFSEMTHRCIVEFKSHSTQYRSFRRRGALSSASVTSVHMWHPTYTHILRPTAIKFRRVTKLEDWKLFLSPLCLKPWDRASGENVFGIPLHLITPFDTIGTIIVFNESKLLNLEYMISKMTGSTWVSECICYR